MSTLHLGKWLSRLVGLGTSRQVEIDFDAQQTILPEAGMFSATEIIRDELQSLLTPYGIKESSHYELKIRQGSEATGVALYTAYITLRVRNMDLLQEGSKIETLLRRALRPEMISLHSLYWRISSKASPPDSIPTTSPSVLDSMAMRPSLTEPKEENFPAYTSHQRPGWQLTQPWSPQ